MRLEFAWRLRVRAPRASISLREYTPRWECCGRKGDGRGSLERLFSSDVRLGTTARDAARPRWGTWLVGQLRLADVASAVVDHDSLDGRDPGGVFGREAPLGDEEVHRLGAVLYLERHRERAVLLGE